MIGLGRQLLATNPSLSDVADKIKALEAEQKLVQKGKYINDLCNSVIDFYKINFTLKKLFNLEVLLLCFIVSFR